MSDLIWVQIVCHSDGTPEWFFEEEKWFKKFSRRLFFEKKLCKWTVHHWHDLMLKVPVNNFSVMSALFYVELVLNRHMIRTQTTVPLKSQTSDPSILSLTLYHTLSQCYSDLYCTAYWPFSSRQHQLIFCAWSALTHWPRKMLGHIRNWFHIKKQHKHTG